MGSGTVRIDRPPALLRPDLDKRFSRYLRELRGEAAKTML